MEALFDSLLSSDSLLIVCGRFSTWLDLMARFRLLLLGCEMLLSPWVAFAREPFDSTVEKTKSGVIYWE